MTSMSYIKNILHNRSSSLIKDCRLYIQRNIRSPVRRIPDRKTPTNPATKSNRQAIEEYDDKLDLNLFGKSLSATARIALKNDPNILTTLNPLIKISENGDLYIKSYKLTSETSKAIKKLETLNQDIANETYREMTKKVEEPDEDPNVPVSSVSCCGCGAKLQCQNKNVEGFLSATVFKDTPKLDLTYQQCLRCDYLRTNKKLSSIESTSFDYDKLILDMLCDKSSEKKRHVVLLVDLLAIPNSIYDGWSRLMGVKNVDLTIIGNKVDLLPNTGPDFMSCVAKCMMENCARKGISGEQIKYVELVSAKNGYNIEKMISNILKIWNDDGDVFLLGAANSGKSVIFNRLLASDYCRTIASTAISKAATSFWPGTTQDILKFPINFLTSKKLALRASRLARDKKTLEEVDEERYINYQKNHKLKDAELLGIVGTTFQAHSAEINEMNTEVAATYSMNSETGSINEGENFNESEQVGKKFIKDAREKYWPEYFKNKAAHFHDTPGVVDTNELLKYFSKQELQIVTPAGILMPRVFWMQPGQTMFVSGLMRIDLLESTNNDRVLFTVMASPAMPIINPFPTEEANERYKEYYDKGTVLRVPHKQHVRDKPLPEMVGKKFSIECIGNHKSMTDIVFSSYGWAAVNSLPGVTAKVKAYTLGGIGLTLREPSLLPYIVNMRSKWFRKDGSQAFKSTYYKKPKTIN